MDAIIDLICGAIGNYSMITPDMVVYAAVSGGADSMAMLSALSALKSALGFTLKAAHFEHGLRGEASRQDAKLVAAYCRENKIELVTGYGHIARLGIPRGYGEEAWARKQRYAFLDSLCTSNAVRIATAHTKNDLAETVLFNIIRGCGQRGAAGIPATRGAYIRPMLAVERAEIEKYCEDNGVLYVQDATNGDNRYARNRIRNLALPALTAINPGAVGNIARFAHNMRALDEWLSKQVVLLMEAAEVHDGKWGYDREFLLEPIREAPQPVLASFFSALFGEGLYWEKVQELCNLACGKRRKVQVSKTGFVWVSGNRLVLSRVDSSSADALPSLRECALGEGNFQYSGGYNFTVRVAARLELRQVLSEDADKGLIFAADYDKISKYSVFRVRRAGDWVCLPRRGISKPLRKWMHEEHIPALTSSGYLKKVDTSLQLSSQTFSICGYLEAHVSRSSSSANRAASSFGAV